ncbi:MAG: 50S ribosomal protein L11 [Clostridiales bacterium]|nr:50S ribosomal protein L11 [Clostridiales bacterium]
MAKKIIALVKLQIMAGKATPAPPVGPALGQHGINIKAFCDEFNKKTQSQNGMIIPVVVNIYFDKSFNFITKVPPVSCLLKKMCNIDSGSKIPNREIVAEINQEQIREIAIKKIEDLNANSIESAIKMICGTARSIGIKVII